MPENSLMEAKKETAATNDRTVLAVLAQAGTEGLLPPELAALAQLPPATCRGVVRRLIDRGQVRRKSERGRLWITPAGMAETGAALAGMGTIRDLDTVLARLPSEALRAYARLLMSTLVARHHLREHRPSGWLSFVAAGPTKTGKTMTGALVAGMFGLDTRHVIRQTSGETEGSLWGRRYQVPGEGWTFEPSPLLAQPLVVLDEFDKAPELRTQVLKLLQGEAQVGSEGRVVDVAPVVVVTTNDQPGSIRPEYRRRSVVLDTGPLLATLDRIGPVARAIFRQGLPRFDLAQFVPTASTLPEPVLDEMDRLLRQGLTDTGWRQADTQGLELAALGRAAITGVSPRSSALATVVDYLACASTVGETAPGWAGLLAGQLAGPLTPDPAQIETERASMVEQADRERQAAERAAIKLNADRRALLTALQQAGTDLRKASVPAALRPRRAGLNQGLRDVFDRVRESRSRGRLQELSILAGDVLGEVATFHTDVRRLAEADALALRAEREAEERAGLTLGPAEGPAERQDDPSSLRPAIRLHLQLSCGHLVPSDRPVALTRKVRCPRCADGRRVMGATSLAG